MQLYWDGRNFRGEISASGVYFIQLCLEQTVQSQKVYYLQ